MNTQDPKRPPTPEELGFREFDYQYIITGKILARNEEQAAQFLHTSIAIMVPLAGAGFNAEAKVRPVSKLQIVNSGGIPPPDRTH